MNKLYVGIAGIILLVVLVVVAVNVNQVKYGQVAKAATTGSDSGCDNCDAHASSAQQASSPDDDGKYMGKVNADGKASGPSLMAAYKADSLYTCPMHPEIITDNPNASCPICGMNLAQMSEEDVTKLIDSKPKGCPMDPVVVQGDSEVEKCSICGMKLMDPKASHGGDMHGGGSHDGHDH